MASQIPGIACFPVNLPSRFYPVDYKIKIDLFLKFIYLRVKGNTLFRSEAVEESRPIDDY